MEKTKRKTGGIAKFQEMSKEWENNPKILRKIIENLSEKIDELQAKANISDEAVETFQEIIRNQCDEITALKEKAEAYDRLMSGGLTMKELERKLECAEFYAKSLEHKIETIEPKATAYDQIMTGGKKTLKKWANLLGMNFAVDRDGHGAGFKDTPEVDYLYGLWLSDNGCSVEIPRSFIEFTGDWKDSLTLPDGWEEACSKI